MLCERSQGGLSPAPEGVTITRLLGKLKEQGAITIDRKNHIVLIERSFKNVVNAGDIAKHAPKQVAERQTKIALGSAL